MQRMTDAFRARLDANVATSVARIRAQRVPFYERLNDAQLAGTFKRAFEAAAQDLVRGEPDQLLRLLRALGAERSQQGVAVMDIVTGLNLGFQVVSEDFAEHFAGDLEARLAWESARGRIAYAGAAALADTYLEAREAVVRAQAEELVALSLRVLPLYPGIVVLPLLGEIAAERAGQLTQVLLAAVARHACRFALIDLSGVPAFDAEAAALLVRAAQAVELLGATPVLVGIRPAAAQAMVERSLVLARLTTLADLESGLRHALGRLGVTFTQAGPR